MHKRRLHPKPPLCKGRWPEGPEGLCAGSRQIYVRSLREYLTHGCNTSATAGAMFIHRNTLRNYLEHIRERTGIDAAQIADGDLLYLYLFCLCAEYAAAKDKALPQR